jgi:hypothetical protein
MSKSVETIGHSAGQIAENAAGYQIHATKASKAEQYVCQACKQNVILRRGKKILKNGQTMVTHFAHSVTNVIKCSGYTGGETLVHLEAKWCVADNIEEFRFIMQSCDICQVANTKSCVRFSKQAWIIAVEGQIAGTGTGKHPRRADVLIRLKTQTDLTVLKPLYSIEVRHSHAVSAEKTKELHSVNCDIIEVLAEDVLHFKDILQADKPCYLRNVHNMGCIKWTCKTCMEQVATERAARWLEYEAWYTYQWINQDTIMARSSKRKLLHAQNEQSTRSHKRKFFEVTSPKYERKCITCEEWIRHTHYTNFYSSGDNITNESWWHDAIRTNLYLANAKFKITRQCYCSNCVKKCLNCGVLRPLVALKKGLCMRCNTDTDWFDTCGKPWRLYEEV